MAETTLHDLGIMIAQSHRDFAAAFACAMDDPKEFKARVKALKDGQKTVEDCLAETRALAVQAATDKAEAATIRETTVADLARLEAVKAGIDSERAALDMAQKAFAEGFEAAEAERRARNDALARRETIVTEREQALAAREAEVELLRQQHESAREDFTAKAARLENALRGVAA